MLKFWLVGGVVVAAIAVLFWHVPPLWCLAYPAVTMGPMLVTFVYSTVPPRKKHP